MLAEAVEEWAAEAHAKGVQEGLSEGGIDMLRRIAVLRFGVAAGNRFGQLLVGEHDPDRLARAGDLMVECANAEELLARTRRLLKGGNGVR